MKKLKHFNLENRGAINMKVVILCGGKGTRLGSPTETIPKTLALVSGKPIIWHIMNMYSMYGFNDFILPLGFGGDKIKEYFWNYEWKNCDFIKELGSDKVTFLNKPSNLKVTFVDTENVFSLVLE